MKGTQVDPTFLTFPIVNAPLLLKQRNKQTETWRFSDKSVLLPTNIIITSFPRSFRTSSIHFEVFKNDARSNDNNYNYYYF